jgi:putative intracellular protease/amidase
MKRWLLALGFVSLVCVSLLPIAGLQRPSPLAHAANPVRGGGSGQVEALLILSDGYGGNTNHIRDAMELSGWNYTYTGVDSVVENCYYGEPKEVDILVSDITDVTQYDVVAIMPGNSHVQILGSPEVLALVNQAANEGLLVIACCGGVRVLAAADVLNGIHVTGKSQFLQEYLDAGAIWVGEPAPPIRDKNILTSVRNQLNCRRIIEVARTGIDSLCAARASR